MKGKESRFIDRKSSFIYSKVSVLFTAISDMLVGEEYEKYHSVAF